MPLKEIVGIWSDGGIFVVPEALRDVYNFKKGDLILCEFKKHLDKKGNFIREINEERIEKIKEPSLFSLFILVPDALYFKDGIIAREYGLRANEYVEIVFKEIRRKAGFLKWKTFPIPQKG